MYIPKKKTEIIQFYVVSTYVMRKPVLVLLFTNLSCCRNEANCYYDGAKLRLILLNIVALRLNVACD